MEGQELSIEMISGALQITFGEDQGFYDLEGMNSWLFDIKTFEEAGLPGMGFIAECDGFKFRLTLEQIS